MKKILVIILVILLLLGGAVGGLYFWGIDPLALVGLKKGDLEAKAQQAAAAAAALAASKPSFLDFGLLVVPIVQNHEVNAQAEIVLRLQMPANKVENVAKYLPRLQAAYLEDMLEFLPKVLNEYGNLDPDAISKRLVEVGGKVFGPDIIQAVVIENMMFHKL
jgi:flagellar protein FliL